MNSKDIIREDYQLYLGDCIEVMRELIDKEVKVDLILTDPPYGTTYCKWDTIIPLDEMWDCINQLSYPTTPTILFATQPFISNLVMSNIDDFSFTMVWDKHRVSNPFLSKRQPLRVHEELAVFYKKQPYYNPQRLPKRYDTKVDYRSEKSKEPMVSDSDILGVTAPRYHYYEDDGTRLPQSIIQAFPGQMNECMNKHRIHPTQKPVAFLEYLIKNWTHENDLVLDFTMGSGSTGVACRNIHRRFIGIELEEEYFDMAKERIMTKQAKLI